MIKQIYFFNLLTNTIHNEELEEIGVSYGSCNTEKLSRPSKISVVYLVDHDNTYHNGEKSKFISLKMREKIKRIDVPAVHNSQNAYYSHPRIEYEHHDWQFPANFSFISNFPSVGLVMIMTIRLNPTEIKERLASGVYAAHNCLRDFLKGDCALHRHH